MIKLHRLLSAALLLTACDSGNEADAGAKDKAAAKAEADADNKPTADAKADAGAETAGDPPGDAKADPAADPTTAPAGGNTFEIVASHAEPKPTDPVTVSVGLKVVTAAFDPKNPEGGTATIELDVAGLDSKSKMRDGHLKSPDYLDAANNPSVTVEISNVKKGEADNAWTATAKVGLRDKSVDWPITFEIVETTETGIRVKGAHKFDRGTIGLGKTSDEGDSVANEIEARYQLMLEPTA